MALPDWAYELDKGDAVYQQDVAAASQKIVVTCTDDFGQVISVINDDELPKDVGR